MDRGIYRTEKDGLRSMEQDNSFFLNRILLVVSMKTRKTDLHWLLIVVSTAVIIILNYWSPKLVAAEDAGIETLLEFNPLDWATIDPPEVVERCTLALAKKTKLSQDQICQLYFTRGIALSFVGKNDQAVRDLTELLHLRPNDHRALLFRGQIYAAGLRQFDKARTDFALSVKLRPTSGAGYGWLALCLNETGDTESSKMLAEKAVTLDPDSPQGYLALADIHLKEHNTKQALKEINQCIALSYGEGTPAAAVPYCLRAGVIMGIYDNPTRAFSNLLMARRLAPSDVSANGMFCEYYFKTGKYNMAFQLIEKLAKEQPLRLDVLGLRVACLIERNRLEDAQQVAKTMIRKDPSWRCFLLRGQVSFAKNEYQDALQDYDKSLALRNDTLGAMAAKAYLLATCPQAKFRNGAEARTLAARCCERTENRAPRYLMVLAMACAECGDYKEAVRLAKESLEKAESSFPYLEDYRRRLSLFKIGKPYRFPADYRPLDYLFP